MRMHKKTALLLVLAMIVASAGTAFAAGLSDSTPPLPCTGENVSGVVTGVTTSPTTGLVEVTITDSNGVSCTTTIPASSTFDHPIVSLLGNYFDVKTSSLETALKDTKVCYLTTGSVEYQENCVAGVGEPLTILGENSDGTFKALKADGTTIDIELPESISGDILQALQSLNINWTLDGTGNMLQAGDLIAQYHDDGMGFGVLVKLFALAQNSQTCTTSGEEEVCGPMNVDTLVQEFNSGTGMGQLFKEYGKPKLLGVGHVRQQNKNETTVNGDDTEVQPNGNANHGQSDKVKPNNIIKNTKAKGPCNVPNNKNKNKCP